MTDDDLAAMVRRAHSAAVIHPTTGMRVYADTRALVAEVLRLREENADLKANLDWAAEPDVIAGVELHLARHAADGFVEPPAAAPHAHITEIDSCP